MRGEWIRRCVVLGTTVFVHARNLCVVGMCEPKAQHDQLMVVNAASIIVNFALVLAIVDTDLWPRRWPFRPFPANLICLIELLATLMISNLLQRLIWLPFVHNAVRWFNCCLQGMFYAMSNVAYPRSKANRLYRTGTYLCSNSGVDDTSTVIAVLILGRVIYALYGERIRCMYKSIVGCATSGSPDEPVSTLAATRRSPGTRKFSCGHVVRPRQRPSAHLFDSVGLRDLGDRASSTAARGDSVRRRSSTVRPLVHQRHYEEYGNDDTVAVDDIYSGVATRSHRTASPSAARRSLRLSRRRGSSSDV